MSLICQNFVQNAWKKDLCSNCFKSFSDHADSLSGDSDDPLNSTEEEENQKNSVISQLGHQRYISQATTIYESRSLLCHPTWKSCLIQDNDSYVLLKRSRKVEEEPPEDTFENAVLTGLTNGLTQGILKVKDKAVSGDPQRKSSSVGFKEDQVQVIGYGGDDYDSDEGNWEMSSDDDDLSLDSLDSTEEEKVITKITRENTDFNSNNENLLRDAFSALLPIQPVTENNPTEVENSPESPSPTELDDESDSPCEMPPPETDNEVCADSPVEDPRVIAATLADNAAATIYEARSSFLHSITQTPPPSAVYTPASDLFVHRGSTSSSSSSGDEQTTKPIPLTKPKIPVKPAHVVKKEAAPACTSERKQASRLEKIAPEIVEPNSCSPSCEQDEASTEPKTQEPTCAAEKREEQSVYYAVSEPFSSSPKPEARNPNLHFSEGNIYQEVKSYQQQQTQQRRPQQDSASKETKLAALAVELEQARYNSPCKRQAPAPPMEQTETPGAVLPPRNDSPQSPSTGKVLGFKSSKPKSSAGASNECLQQEDANAMKNGKKGIFSFKKLLKRSSNKDGTNGSEDPSKPLNQKAWKHSDLDRSRLQRLEILHPMDLAASMTPSGEGSSSSLESVTATTPVRVLEDGMYEGVTVEKYGPVPLPADCKNVHQICPRSPSPDWSRTATNSSPESRRDCPSQASSSSERPGRPPPPPQRYKNHSPPTTPPLGDCTDTASGPPSSNPAKPVVPRRLFRPSMKHEKSDYANLADDVRDWISGFVSKKLGNVRSPMAPKKPERSSSLVSSSGENSGEDEAIPPSADNTYEMISCRGVNDAKNTPRGKNLPQEEELYSNATSTVRQVARTGDRQVRIAGQGDKPPSRDRGTRSCPDHDQRSWEWHTLESSYALITASVYETLTKYLNHMSKCSRSLPWENQPKQVLRWKDFQVGNPSVDGNLRVYEGLHRDTSSLVTLLAAETSPSRQMVLRPTDHRTVSSFVDTDNGSLVVVMPRGSVSAVGNFSLNTSPQHVAYILLQLIGSLEGLQSAGITSVENAMETCWLAQWDEHQPQLVFLQFQGGSSNGRRDTKEPLSLCQHVQATLLQLLRCSKDSDLSSQSGFKIFGILMDLLVEEKADSLSQAKLVLQYYLWAPWQLLKRSWPSELTSHLRRWLDIERANFCKRLSNRLHAESAPCSVFLEHQAAFLVNASARVLSETSLLLNDKGYFAADDSASEGEELYQDRLLTPL